METLGYLLKFHRKQEHLSMEDLARTSSCSLDHVRKLEADRYNPSHALLERMITSLQLDKEDATRLRVTLAANRLPSSLLKYVTVIEKKRKR